MGVVREPLAVLLGILCFACAAGAAWQSGLAWPAAGGRPWARVAAAAGLVLAAIGFSLGYWEVLSGIGAVIWHFDAATTRFLFDVAVFGLPFAVLGLLLGTAAMLHAADIPLRAVVPAIGAGYAVLWLLDPYDVLAGPRMLPVRARYAPEVPKSPASAGRASDWSLFGAFGDGGNGGGPGGGDGDGAAAGPIVLLLVALAVLAIAGGLLTAILVFVAGRRRAKTELERHQLLRTGKARSAASESSG